MPIKLPKGFPRRKSSGNVLDDVQKPQHNTSESISSFKVLTRPQSTGRPLDGTSPSHSTESRPQPPPKSSFEDDREDLFSVLQNDATNRGATANSLSTTAHYDSGASSTRLSSSSTNPSSVDTASGRNVKAAAQRAYDDIPVPPPHGTRAGFLKNAGRTFSFGMNKNNSREVHDLPPIPAEKTRRTTITNSRDRAMTIGNVTTTTAPRLDDSDFSSKDSDDGFGNMFADLNPKTSNRESLTNMQPAPLKPSAAHAAPLQPIYVNSGADLENSPYSWNSPNSQNSTDGLIASPSPSSRTVIQASPQPSALRPMASASVHSEVTQNENQFDSTPRHHSPVAASSQLRVSPVSSRAPPSSFPTTTTNRSRAQSNAASTIRSYTTDTHELDPAFLANAQLANRYEETQPSPVLQHSNKVMTPAEFERYRQQKEDTRRYNKVFGKTDSDDGSGDDYDDDEEEDEQKRENHAVKQRKKQEAHLAIYRQQMMKVTGDTAPTPERRPGTSMSGYRTGNSSQLDLMATDRRMSSLTVGGMDSAPGIGKPPLDDGDEDEDVPLGILAAHGFPNKNRPPTRLAASSSNPNLRTLAQTQGGASVVGGDGGRGPLPAFARNLPSDPYYGASLIHQTERTPLQMHAPGSQTHLAAQPQPSGAATAHPLHPAGLVGVIAGEERARAMRRGSPNPQGTGYDMPMGGSQPMRTGPQQPMLTPSEHAQLQMSQNMAQMMQMQMQWMQQMSTMMGQNPNMQMPPMPMMGVPGMPPQLTQMQQHGNAVMQPQPNGLPARPQSVPLQTLNGGNQRTMSTLAPSMAGWFQSSPAVPQIQGPGSIYAPSIAPSERSNVGLASRYRPVSTMMQEPENNNWAKRASTFTSTAFRPWANENGPSKLTHPTVRTVQPADDDDDEQGWAEMQARRDKKQKGWKLRKGGKDNSLKELYNAPA